LLIWINEFGIAVDLPDTIQAEGGVKVSATAESIFLEGFNCAQAVFASHAEYLGVSKEFALRVASGLGAGMGRMQETCGAVTGGCLVLGLRFGKTDTSDVDGKEITYILVQSLHRQFAEAHGSTHCRDLLGCDLRTDEGKRKYKKDDLAKNKCLECVRTADRIVREILDNNPRRGRGVPGQAVV
jgi:C_GCAxxG_C_C family probable redox protein